MADYFLVHDRAAFEQQLRPALAAAWQARSFAPCLSVCRDWTPAAHEYARRYHVKADDILLFRVAEGLCFDRAFWRTLVGELLLFAAREIPEFPTNLATLLQLVEPGEVQQGEAQRERRSPVQQALHGSRDLVFGAVPYRPEHAGYNNAGDVARLARYLASIGAEVWTIADLPAGTCAGDEEDREEELAFAKEWFAVLRDLYVRASTSDQVVILESIF
jgi:hypothetical protein